MFVQVFHGKVDDAPGFRRQMERWKAELRPGAAGFLGGTAGVTDDGRFIALARFESDEEARASSGRPEQGAWWAETARCIDGEAEFHDCDEVVTLLGGGSDNAGFVQVIRGRAVDADRARAMAQTAEVLIPRFRPDVIGGLIAVEEGASPRRSTSPPRRRPAPTRPRNRRSASAHCCGPTRRFGRTSSITTCAILCSCDRTADPCAGHERRQAGQTGTESRSPRAGVQDRVIGSTDRAQGGWVPGASRRRDEMIFTQHYLACLSHASYLIGDEASGRAVVVDPRRDIGVYVEQAALAGLTIERVIETHLHADFLSGHLELAARTGAAISYGEGAQVEFPMEPLHDGQRLLLGEVELEILATPGHTPESICIAVYEHPGDDRPYGVLTGDTLFVGDVGRPDLLASSGAGLSADALARRLYHSLHDKLGRLPDATQVFPAHGAGSSCGKQLSSETSSTLGDQRRVNYALQPMSEDQFVALVTEGQPPRPRYFEFDARRNRELHPLLDEAVPPPLLELEDVLARQRDGALLLDAREPAEFAAGHLRGAVNVGLGGRFAEWAAAVLTPARDLLLVGDPASALEAKVRLGRVGFDRIDGQLRDPAEALAGRPELAETSSRLTVEQLTELTGRVPTQLVDVRSPGETADGTLPGAQEIPLAVIADSLEGLDRSLPVVVYCASGYRSVVAASLLRQASFEDVSDLLGGYTAWVAAGRPVTTSTS